MPGEQSPWSNQAKLSAKFHMPESRCNAVGRNPRAPPQSYQNVGTHAQPFDRLQIENKRQVAYWFASLDTSLLVQRKAWGWGASATLYVKRAVVRGRTG
jgi:hypothetical protein